MYLGNFIALLLALFAAGSAPAEAQQRRNGGTGIYAYGDLQVTKLFCAIRDGKFITFLDFKVQTVTDHPELTAEISNYMEQQNGTRKYISGILFTSINYSNLKVTGDTGDPSDIVGRFTLTRMDATYQGRWAYEFRRSETEVVRAVFNCSYNDTPPSERRRRWPRP